MKMQRTLAPFILASSLFVPAAASAEWTGQDFVDISEP